MGISENKATLERFDSLTAGGDPDELDELCTPDMVNHALASHRTPGLEGTEEFLWECQRDRGRDAWRRSMISDQQLVTIGERD